MFAQSWVGSGNVGGEVEIGRPAVTIKIDTVYGPNSNGSFTTKEGEQHVTLKATVTPAALAPDVEWSVTRAPQAATETQLPGTTPRAGSSSFMVPTPSNTPNRWQGYGHPGDLIVKRLGYDATASVSSGGTTYRADAARVYQDQIDVIRQEYVELRTPRGVPGRTEFAPYSRCEIVCINVGDYGFAIVNETFDDSLASLRRAWTEAGQQWQINGLYRNPVHNRFHVRPEDRPDPNSLHMDGCAADVQTFPIGNQTARLRFFNDLNDLARTQNLQFESLRQMGGSPTHVHVELDPCPLPNR
jgi:hypothetical protein